MKCAHFVRNDNFLSLFLGCHHGTLKTDQPARPPSATINPPYTSITRGFSREIPPLPSLRFIPLNNVEWSLYAVQTANGDISDWGDETITGGSDIATAVGGTSTAVGATSASVGNTISEPAVRASEHRRQPPPSRYRLSRVSTYHSVRTGYCVMAGSGVRMVSPWAMAWQMSIRSKGSLW